MNATLCYEEFANSTSTGCTYGNGSYAFNGPWWYMSYVHNTTDGDYDTYAMPKPNYGGGGGEAGFNVTYYLNNSNNISGLWWQVKYGLVDGTGAYSNTTGNYSIPYSCFINNYSVTLRFNQSGVDGSNPSDVYLSCWNGTAFNLLFSSIRYLYNDTSFFEEGLWVDSAMPYVPPTVPGAPTYDICYAEWANVSACTPQYSNGTYAQNNFYNTSPWFYYKIWDGNYSTRGLLYNNPSVETEIYYYNLSLVNWIKIQSRTGCTNNTHDNYYTINGTIPAECYNNKIYIQGSQTSNNITCFNGTVNLTVYSGNWSGTICSNGANPLYLPTGDRALYESGLYINWTNGTVPASYNLSATYNATNVSNTTTNELVNTTYRIVWAGQFVNATLHWNGVSYPATSDDLLTYTAYVIPDLVATNTTNVSYWWEGYTTGGVYVNTTVGNTSIYFSYWNTTFTLNNTEAIHSSYLGANYSIKNLSSLGNLSIQFYNFEYNGTLYDNFTNTTPANNGTNYYFYKPFWVNLISNTSLNRNFGVNATVSYNGINRTIGLQNLSYTVLNASLSLNCTSGNMTSNYSFIDADTGAYLDNVSINVSLNYTLSNVTFQTSGNYVTEARTFFGICSGYNFSNYTSNISINYTRIPGDYWPANITLFGNFEDNVTTQYSLLLLNSSLGTEITFTITDITGYNPIQGATVQVFTNGSGVPFESEVTDSFGNAKLFLNQNVSYSILVFRTNYTNYTGTLKPINTAYTIKLSSSNFSIPATVFDNITWLFVPSVGVIYPNGTNNYTINFTLTDAGGNLNLSGLRLTWNGTVLNEGNASTSGGGTYSLSVNLTNKSGILTAVGYFQKPGFPITNVTKSYNIYYSYSGNFSMTTVFTDLGAVFNANNMGPVLAFICLILIVAIGTLLGGGIIGAVAGVIMLVLFTFIGVIPWGITIGTLAIVISLVVIRGRL